MPNTHSFQEIEIKLRVPDISVLRARLRTLQAQVITTRTYESNTLYDTGANDLTHRGQLIRIRTERPVSKGRSRVTKPKVNAILTYKGPTRNSTKTQKGAKEARARFKVREEVEVIMSDGEKMTEILQALNLRPVFRYEKFRTTYGLPGVPKVKVELDETPVGLFLELEGHERSIDRVARLLGYKRSDYMTETYGALYVADCRKRGVSPSDMLFSATKWK